MRLKYQQAALCGCSILLILMLPIASRSAAADESSALKLVPDSVAGAVQIPDVPQLRQAWQTTNLAAMFEDEALQPFLEFRRQHTKEKGGVFGFNVGLSLSDIADIASGEVVAFWQPFDDRRRPFAAAVVIDVQGNHAMAARRLAQIDAALKQQGATVQESSFDGKTILKYTLKRPEGQIKVDEVVITLSPQRLIAADRESVVTALLEAIADEDQVAKLDASPDYLGVQQQIDQSSSVAGNDQVVVGLNWFARPIAMGRIIKEAAQVDRGRQVDILNLLERQGFDAVQAVGGRLSIGHAKFDLVHHGFIWAPPVDGEPDRYRLAARMLRSINLPLAAVPAWIGPDTASFARLNWDLSGAFWHAESLVDDAFGAEVFQETLDGIRDDEEGPQIDFAEDVVPNLSDHLLIITDNVTPIDARSERMMLAIATSDVDALRDAVRRAMEVEPAATLLDPVVPGIDIYRVLNTEDADDFEKEVLGDLFDDFEEDDVPAPLLNQWAITVIDDASAGGADKSGYLVFSSHAEMVVEAVERLADDDRGAGFGNDPDLIPVQGHAAALLGDAPEQTFSRFAKSSLTLRAKYSLMRQGKLRESDSVMASLFRRLIVNGDERPEDVGLDRLPPFEQIETYLRPAGGVSRATPDGWTLDGFLLK